MYLAKFFNNVSICTKIMPTEILNNLKIDNYYKFILYMSGICILFSLFVGSPIVDNTLILKVSISCAIGGLIAWLVDTFFGRVNNAVYENCIREHNQKKYHKIGKIFLFLNFSIHSILWLIIVIYIFNTILV